LEIKDNMKKRKLILIILTFILFFIVLLNIVSIVYPTNSMEDFFEAWQVTNDSSVAIVDDRAETITFNEKTVNVRAILKKYYSNPDLHTLLLKSDWKLYGIHAYNFTDEVYYETIDLYAIDLETESLEVLYTSPYCPRENADSYEKLRNVEVHYSNRNIIVYDGTVVTKYNIDTSSVENLPPTELSYPKKPYTVETVNDNNGEIYWKKCKIISESGERMISVEYMAQKHEYIHKLLEFGKHKTLFGTIDPLERFFYNSYVINEKIYLVCCILDRDGERNATVFSYDYKSETFEFIYHGFSGGIPRIYLIPNE